MPKLTTLITLVALSMTSLSVAQPLPLKTKGNQVLNSKNQPVRLTGVNTASLEWDSKGEGRVLKSIDVAIKDWNCNIIRLPLSQDRWFGKAPDQKDGGHSYRLIVQQAVDKCSKAKVYIMLDLHWNNLGTWGQNIGQHIMPDMLSLEFWKNCAARFKNNPAVLFDLYNEPHDTTWDIWRDGGWIDEQKPVGARQGPFIPTKYQTPGMQKMLDTVRATGAKNVVVVGGLDWSYDLSGFLKGYALKDPKGNGIIYACHAYPFKGDTVEQFLVKLDKALPKIPVIISEFGSDHAEHDPGDEPNPWVVRIMSEFEKRQVHFTAWDFHPAAGPCLIKDWNYTPTKHFGEIVLKALKTHRK